MHCDRWRTPKSWCALDQMVVFLRFLYIIVVEQAGKTIGKFAFTTSPSIPHSAVAMAPIGLSVCCSAVLFDRILSPLNCTEVQLTTFLSQVGQSMALLHTKIVIATKKHASPGASLWISLRGSYRHVGSKSRVTEQSLGNRC